jgi:hypothetical protein
MTAIFTGVLAILGMAILLIPGTSGATSGEDSSNITKSLSPQSITMNPSNIITDNQTTNRIDETPKSNTTLHGNLSRGIVITNTTNSISFPYEVTVRFDSITVNENHETTFLNDAQYDLSAFVQGNRIPLTDRSFRGTCSGVGDPLPCGLGDVSEGETVTFTPGTEVTVYLPTTLELSIFTVGQEVDLCGTLDFDNPLGENLRQGLVETFKDDSLNWLEAINTYLNRMVPSDDLSLICAIDSNDRLGDIIKFYPPIGYGTGAHSIGTNAGDYTLRYTITVTPPPIPGMNRQLDSNSFLNQMNQNNTFASNNTEWYSS